VGVKRQEREADHSLLSSVEVKNSGALTQLPHMSSRHDVQLLKHRNNSTFYLNIIKYGHV
jgi:hypothetical protein